MFRLKDTARRRFIVDIVVNVEGPDIVASMFSRQPIATTTNVKDITANNQSQKMLYVLSYHRANSYKQSHGPLESLPNCLTRVCNVRLSSSRGCFNPRRLERLLHCTSNKVVLGRLCGRSQGHTSNDSNHVQTTLSHGCELMSQAQMRTAALAGPSSLRRQASRFTMLVASSRFLGRLLGSLYVGMQFFYSTQPLFQSRVPVSTMLYLLSRSTASRPEQGHHGAGFGI